ncbi:hypothetical protein EV121DRAFT_292843 [Schizophyllum commune]
MLTSFSAVFFAPLTAENKVYFSNPEPPEAHARTPLELWGSTRAALSLQTPSRRRHMWGHSAKSAAGVGYPFWSTLLTPEPPEAHAGSLGKGC